MHSHTGADNMVGISYHGDVLTETWTPLNKTSTTRYLYLIKHLLDLEKGQLPFNTLTVSSFFFYTLFTVDSSEC